MSITIEDEGGIIEHSKSSKFNVWTLISVIVLLSVPFAWHAVNQGIMTILTDEAKTHWIFENSSFVENTSISLHMIAGGIITLLMPVQVLLGWNNAAMTVHKYMGYTFVVLAFLAGVFGNYYALSHGTVGGIMMDVAFVMYGAIIMLSAYKTVMHVRAGDMEKHQQWAIRLFAMSIASWLYRVQYGIWMAYHQGPVGMTPDFRGWFDYIQDFAFFVPALVLLEVWFRWGHKKDVHPAVVIVSVLGLSSALTIGFMVMWGSSLFA